MDQILRGLDFGNEAADDVDPNELASYFVEQAAFGNFIDQRKTFLVATARKGVGKSALLQWIAHKVSTRDSEAVVIKIRGAELITPNDYIQDWMVRLCAVVNRQLAAQLRIALTDDRTILTLAFEDSLACTRRFTTSVRYHGFSRSLRRSPLSKLAESAIG